MLRNSLAALRCMRLLGDAHRRKPHQIIMPLALVHYPGGGSLVPAFRSPGPGHARPGRKPRPPWRRSPPPRALAALMSQPWQAPRSLPIKARKAEPRRDHATPRLGHALAFIELAHELHLLSVRGVVRQINPEPLRPEANPRRAPIRSSAMAGKSPNARVQRGRERHRGKPFELRFTASAATPC